jgi:hypothetical protein
MNGTPNYMTVLQAGNEVLPDSYAAINARITEGLGKYFPSSLDDGLYKGNNGLFQNHPDISSTVQNQLDQSRLNTDPRRRQLESKIAGIFKGIPIASGDIAGNYR